MPPLIATLFLACCVVVFGSPVLAACNQTLSVGANVAAAVASAPDGSTICLNSGDYGAVAFTNIARAGFVTVRSTSGVEARISPRLGNVDFVRFQSLTVTDMQVSGCSTNIQVFGNTFVPNTPQLHFNDYLAGCNGPKNHLIDGNTFHKGKQSLQEGRVTLQDVDGVTFSNNIISGEPDSGAGSDGVQITGNSDQITIGPGNIFENLWQSECGEPAHCDCIQLYSGGVGIAITGNWFRNVAVPLQYHGGSESRVSMTNNVIQNAAQIWAYEKAADGFLFEHNTVFNVAGIIALGSNGYGAVSMGVIGRSNIFINGTSVTTFGCNGCSFSHNLGSTAQEAPGTNAIIGTPTFLGGAPQSITAWSGWQLAPGSLGRASAHDGRDRGTLYYPSGAGDTLAPSPPRALRTGSP